MTKKTKAVAYYRTSSAGNVGADKDSRPRQQAAVKAFADASGFEIVAEFYDGAVSGEDELEARPGFADLLNRIEGNGCKTVLVESADRLARSVLVQEVGILVLKERGVEVITSSGFNLTETNDPAKVAMRQMAAVFSQFEKARIVARLRGARERKRAGGVKVEGRKSLAELHPEAVTLAHKLRRKSPKAGRKSLREISALLAEQGYISKSGKPFTAVAISRMLEQ